jgi:hypothetical protein
MKTRKSRTGGQTLREETARREAGLRKARKSKTGESGVGVSSRGFGPRDLAEPVYRMMFDVKFAGKAFRNGTATKEDAATLREQVMSANFSSVDPGFGIAFNTLHMRFGLLDLDGKVKPLDSIEKLSRGRAEFDVTIAAHNKVGKVLRRTKLSGCTVRRISTMDSFDCSDDGIFDLEVEFDFKRKTVR